MSSSDIVATRGEILRIVDGALAYVVLADPHVVLPLVPSALANYRGETFEEWNIHEGSAVEVGFCRSAGTIESVKLSQRVAQRAENGNRTVELPRPTFDHQNRSHEEQKILHPEMGAATTISAPRAFHPEVRAFGKLVDCTALQPGDLLLSQDLHPEEVSKLIAKVQLNGGYSKLDAQWTHAAMYLGDGENVVEATFDNLFSSGSVRITSLDDYCTGKYALRFRRSKHVRSIQTGWYLCIRALTRLKQPYSFAHAAKLWWDVVIRKSGFYDHESQRPTSKAVICSTLYSDAHNEATRQRLGEIGGVCVPAWLSVSDELNDVAVGWAKIA
jgi:hypothetical protein